jgi:hypothetical protein
MKAKNSVKEMLSTPENVTLVTDWLVGNKDKTRTDLAKYMCERLGLRDGKGALRLSSALKALRDLEGEGYWKLPAPKAHGGGEWNPRRLGHAVAAPRGGGRRGLIKWWGWNLLRCAPVMTNICGYGTSRCWWSIHCMTAGWSESSYAT